MHRHLAALVVCILLLFVLPANAQDGTLGIDLERIQRATVFVIQTRDVGGRSVTTCVGSGTIVSRTGLIVANAHNTVQNRDCPGDRIIIAMTIRPDTPPIPSYYVEIAQVNEGLDLALLRVTQNLNNRLIDPEELALPFVEVSDSSQVEIDDTITVVGYPGIGNEDTVDTVRGTVTGFVAEPSGGERAWFKTEAPIPGTMTGGGVYDRTGRLIAVPTTVPVVPLISDATCPIIDDTNNDGTVSRADSCVPIGGFINALRPSNFVRPLLRGASLGINVERLSRTNLDLDSGGEPEFSRLFISPSVVQGMPTTVASSLPTGTTSLYLFFDYRNFTPQTIYELRVSINGTPSPEFSLPPVQWSGGTSGLWYIGSSGQPWPNGTYEFRLFIDGLSAASKAITIGGPAQERPTFSKVAFGLLDDSGVFQGESYVLPAGNTVEARFIYRNMQPGMNWGAVWYFNGGVLTQQQSSWAGNAELTDPVNGTRPISIDVAQGLQKLVDAVEFVEKRKW